MFIALAIILKLSQNIEKAQREIDRLEAEAMEAQSSGKFSSNRRTHDSSKKSPIVNQSINGSASGSAEVTQQKGAAIDVMEDLGKASVEDKAEA